MTGRRDLVYFQENPAKRHFLGSSP